jgi:HPr kinase/phosphorylase
MSQTIHGVGLSIFGLGIILTGGSGIGKSELALELLSRGHQIIADDMLNLNVINNRLVMQNPLQKFIIHIRDIGFIDAQVIFDSTHTLAFSNVDMIIKLTRESHYIPLEQPKNRLTLLGQEIIEYSLSAMPNKPLYILTEILVKYHKQLSSGIDSHQDFINYHQGLMKENTSCN